MPGGGDGPPGGGDGPPGGGDPGADANLPNIPRPSDRFISKEPQVFTGDHTKADEFFTQWNLFIGVNFNNPAMTNAFPELCFSSRTYKDLTLTNGFSRNTGGW